MNWSPSFSLSGTAEAGLTLERRETGLLGAWELLPGILRDSPGTFSGRLSASKKVLDLVLANRLFRDNHSLSKRGTARGLHDQWRHPPIYGAG